MLGAAFSVGCGGGSGGTGEDLETGLLEDTSTDTSGGEVEVDSGTEDGFNPMFDTGSEAAPDTSAPDTAPEATPDVDVDTGAPDTGAPDTGPEDTGPPDTGPADTGPADTGPTCVEGAPCDDGDKCFTGKTLNTACVCGGGTAVVCDDTNACTTDTCEAATGCKYTNVGDGTSCGAGKKCTAGVCADLCTVGADCNDGNACTTGEKFDASCACVGGTAVTCNDSNACTADSCVPATGCVFTPTSEGMSPTGCAAPNTCKGGVCTTPPEPPTVSFTTPVDGLMHGFTSSSSACNGLTFTVSVNAPAGIQTVSWHLFTPTRTTSQMGGDDCGAPATALPPWRAGLGKPQFPFKMADSAITGTSGTFTENIDTNGNFDGIAPWLFCTAPGTGGTTAATALDGTAIPPASTSGGGLRALANICHSTNTTNSADRQWTLIVRVVDKAGGIATAERKFIVYKL